MQSTLTADGSEQTVDEFNLDRGGVLHYFIDLTNMAAGDTTVIREYVDIDGDGNYTLHAQATYADAQAEPAISQSHRLMTTSGVPVKVTLEQTGGTLRDYDYATGVQH